MASDQLGGCFFPSSSIRTRRTWPPSVPLLLLSSAFLLLLFMSTIAFLFLILPALFNFLVSNVPLLYRSLHSWLSPPYLYLVINGIIVSIAASSRFHHHPSHDHLLLHASDDKQQPTTTTTTLPIITSSYDDGDDDHDLRRLSSSTAAYAADADLSTTQVQVQEQQQPAEELVISQSSQLLPLSIGKEHSIDEPSNQKPLLSARFTAQRKSVKAGGPSEGNRVLLAGGVSKPKRNETLESTWKAITEGRATPLARVHHHLKKSETTVLMDQEVVGRSSSSEEEEEEKKEEEGLVTPVKKKADMSKEQRRRWSPSPRKEASPSHEELNRRVEAFINKFNEEMRLQRQESFNHYLEMVNRGSN